jgi:SAM-dependent methyltransferase
VTEGVDLAGKQVLEVGSGRGGGSSFIARYYAPGHIVGIDWSPDAVALSRARHMVTALDFEVGDAERLAFAAQSFDAVINVESSHCYGDVPAFLQSVRRVLRADGHFLYADFRPRTELEAWRALIHGAGFRIAREREITAGVVAALDADHEHKRQLIEAHVGPLLQRAFHHFAGLRGTGIYELFSSGAFAYCAFVCVPARSADAH